MCKELIESWNGNLTIKESRVIVKGIGDGNIVVPSRMYPLANNEDGIKYEIFCPWNTEDFEADSTAAGIFDNTELLMGKCYTNTERLVDALRAAGINAESYVGWLFMGEGELPVHHAFVVVDGNKVIDYAAYFTNDRIAEIDKKAASSKKSPRELMVEQYLEIYKLPHHEALGYGKVKEPYLYIATKCSPDEGRKMYNEMMQAYPDHICYRNLKSSTSASAMQEDIYRAGGK